MHTEISNDALMVSRRDVARSVRDRAAVAAFPGFMDDIRRAVLTPTQKLGCELLAEDTLLRGFFSVWYGRLEDLVLDVPGEPPRANLEANDLSPLLKQLEAMGIIRAEWSARAGWYVLMLPLSSNWNVQWRCPASRRAARWLHQDGLRRVATPFLPAFAPDADLYDALARSSASIADCAGEPPAANALISSTGERKIVVACRGNDFSLHKKSDALDVATATERGAVAPCRSESRKANSPAKAGCFLKVGTRTDRYARASSCSGELSSKTEQGAGKITGLCREKREELKGKIQGDKREFLYAARMVIGDYDWFTRTNGFAANGARWTARFNAGGACRAKARAVFAEMLGEEFVALKSNAQAAEDLWKQLCGKALDAARFRPVEKNLGTLQFKQ